MDNAKVFNIATGKELTETEIQALATQTMLRDLSRIERQLNERGDQGAAMHVAAALDLLRESMANGYKTFLQEKEAAAVELRQPTAADTVEVS